MKNDDLSVIIRSVGERTEQLCYELVNQQVISANITILHEVPFSRALIRGLEIGLAIGKRWTLCLDADVLLSIDAINDLIAEAEKYKSHLHLLGVGGRVYDKFYNFATMGGPHIYCTQSIKMALEKAADASLSYELRPETALKQLMKNAGYTWVVSKKLTGLHDYGQYYKDIFRKMAVRANKSSQEVDHLLYVSKINHEYTDFFVASLGLGYGSLLPEVSTQLNAEHWEKLSKPLLNVVGLQEKKTLGLPEIEELKHQIRSVRNGSNKITAMKPYSRKKFFVWRIGRKLKQYGSLIENWSMGRNS